MLKQLFISLIILSALTSEGIINFPVNIYNLCLGLNDIRQSQDGSAETAENTQEGHNSNSPYFVTPAPGAFILSADSVRKLKPGQYSMGSDGNGISSKAPSAVCILNLFVLAVCLARLSMFLLACKDRKVIITRSDLSPPGIVVL